MPHCVAPSVNVLIINGGKILLSRRANTGWMDGHLCLPGGHVEQGERPRVAALRELQEELGVTVAEDDLEFVCVAARNTTPNEYVAYEFAVRDKDYEYTNAEPKLCSELVWADLENLPADIIDDFKHVINDGISGKQSFLELGF